jgi:hypothetical protein
MAMIEQNYFGRSGKEAVDILQAAIGVVGKVGETLYDRTDNTRKMMWYQLMGRLRARKIRPAYGRGFH